MKRARRFWTSRSGATAAEFALILPAVIFLIFGALNLCFVTYASVNLHSAVETAARYASTKTAAAAGTDPGSTAVQSNFTSHYKGPALTGLSANFHYSTSGCGTSGHTVTDSGTYKVFYGWGALNIPVSATACFP